jgi:hypothetical protein
MPLPSHHLIKQISELGRPRKIKQVRKEEKILRSHHSFQEVYDLLRDGNGLFR